MLYFVITIILVATLELLGRKKVKLQEIVDQADLEGKKNDGKLGSAKGVYGKAGIQHSCRHEKLAIERIAITVEVILVFLAVTSAICFDSFQERMSVKQEVKYAQSDASMQAEFLSDCIEGYLNGEITKDDFVSNVDVNFSLMEILTKGDSARNQIPAAALSYIYYSQTSMEEILEAMDEGRFDIDTTIAYTRSLIFYLESSADILEDVEEYLIFCCSRDSLQTSINKIYGELEANTGASIYIP